MIKFVKKHKILTVLVVLALAGGGYYYYRFTNKPPAVTKYVLTPAAKADIITTVSGTGQVSAVNQLDIKPKVSGDITAVKVAVGQQVKAGDVIARLDATDAQKAVRDAQVNLDSAKLSLAKLQEPADSLSILQAQNAIVQAQNSKQTAEDNLTKDYDDGFNSVANAFIDLPTVMTGMTNILTGTTYASQWNMDYYADSVRQYDENVMAYRDDTNAAFQKAQTEYNQAFNDYKAANRYSDHQTIENLVTETYNTTKDMAEAVKSASNLIQFYEDRLTERGLAPQPQANSHLSSLSSYIGMTNSQLTSLLNASQAFQNDRQAITDAQSSITEKTAALAKLQAPPDPLDIQSQELSIKQRQNSLADAQANLAYYTVYAPFDGVIATVNAQRGDAAGTGTALATIVSSQQLADVTLNEVDAVKVKSGQKATITFDALPDLSIAAQVASIDVLGTTSQGVVSYNVELAFSVQDERVRPGMTVTASIVTDTLTDVLTVPVSAVKTSGGQSYVEMIDNGTPDTSGGSGNGTTTVSSTTPPRRQLVTVGVSNDAVTEITDGLNEGELVVTKTISDSTTTTTQQRSILNSIGGSRTGSTGGAANMRFVGGGRPD